MSWRNCPLDHLQRVLTLTDEALDDAKRMSEHLLYRKRRMTWRSIGEYSRYRRGLVREIAKRLNRPAPQAPY